MTGPAGGAVDRIEERLREAGLPALPRTAWLEIDLDRLAGNLAAMRAALPPTVAIEIVVKADAYGHGAVPVAWAALAAGAAGLCVATLDEALELRRAGIDAPMLVLFAIPPGAAPIAARAGVEIAAGDAGLLDEALAAYAAARRRSRPDFPTSGSSSPSRRGWDATASRRTRRSPPPSGSPRRRGPCSAGPGRTSRRRRTGPAPTPRSERFADALGDLEAGGTRIVHRHILASGGLIGVERLVGGERPAFDGVRVGLAALGIVPEGVPVGAAAAGIHAGLRPILSLRARPIRVADLPAGSGVSYGPTFVTARPSRIATLPLGYADGWPRSLSNRATALVRGVRVPLVGNVAMDAVMADVTDVPGRPVTPADEFVLLGAQGSDAISAADLAQERTTISWEVVATMSRRLPRVYTSRAVAVGIRTLTEDRGTWRSSRSGTATSAISRSTRS